MAKNPSRFHWSNLVEVIYCNPRNPTPNWNTAPICGIKSDLQVTNSCIFLQFAHMKSALKFWNPSKKKIAARSDLAEAVCGLPLLHLSKKRWENPCGSLQALPVSFSSMAIESARVAVANHSKAHALHGINQSRGLSQLLRPHCEGALKIGRFGLASGVASNTWNVEPAMTWGFLLQLTVITCDLGAATRLKGSGVFFNKPCGEKVTPCLFDLNFPRPKDAEIYKRHTRISTIYLLP